MNGKARQLLVALSVNRCYETGMRVITVVPHMSLFRRLLLMGLM
jgi:hypothetical protein